MSLHDELVEKYKDLLTGMGLIVDLPYVRLAESNGVETPITVHDKPLVLPTRDLLKENSWDSLQPFHPLAENPLRGESVILKKLRVLVAFHATSVVLTLAEELLTIASDGALQAKLSPKASEFLSHVGDVDAKTLKAMDSVRKKITVLGDHRLVGFYFSRPGDQRKDSYTRLCRVDFPIFDALADKEPTIFGVTMRHRDKKAILGVLDWLIYPKHDEDADLAGFYNAGTRTLSAPYFVTLMTAFKKLMHELNSKIKLFKKTIPDVVAETLTDLSWFDIVDDIDHYRDIIPALPGNEGVVSSHPKNDGAEVKGTPMLNINTPLGGQRDEPAPAVAAPPVIRPAQPVQQTADENDDGYIVNSLGIRMPKSPNLTAARVPMPVQAPIPQVPQVPAYVAPPVVQTPQVQTQVQSNGKVRMGDLMPGAAQQPAGGYQPPPQPLTGRQAFRAQQAAQQAIITPGFIPPRRW